MAEITLTITLPDIEAHALAIIVAILGEEQLEHAYQCWLNHWKAHEGLQSTGPYGRSNERCHPEGYAALGDVLVNALSRHRSR